MVTESIFQKIRHTLGRLFWRIREETALEHDLMVKCQFLGERLSKVERSLAGERIDWELAEKKLRAEADSFGHQVELLAGIIERDRMRVESETSAYARAVAQNTAPRQA